MLTSTPHTRPLKKPHCKSAAAEGIESEGRPLSGLEDLTQIHWCQWKDSHSFQWALAQAWQRRQTAPSLHRRNTLSSGVRRHCQELRWVQGGWMDSLIPRPWHATASDQISQSCYHLAFPRHHRCTWPFADSAPSDLILSPVATCPMRLI